jgi:hypothetical protein
MPTAEEKLVCNCLSSLYFFLLKIPAFLGVFAICGRTFQILAFTQAHDVESGTKNEGVSSGIPNRSRVEGGYGVFTCSSIFTSSFSFYDSLCGLLSGSPIYKIVFVNPVNIMRCSSGLFLRASLKL